MSTDEKIRYGMMALGGASIVMAAFGFHITPLQQQAGSWGP